MRRNDSIALPTSSPPLLHSYLEPTLFRDSGYDATTAEVSLSACCFVAIERRRIKIQLFENLFEIGKKKISFSRYFSLLLFDNF